MSKKQQLIFEEKSHLSKIKPNCANSCHDIGTIGKKISWQAIIVITLADSLYNKEIDDIEFSPDNTKVVTISKDSRALVWDVKKGKKHAEMGWDKGKVKYLYKRIRFGRIEGDSR